MEAKFSFLIIITTTLCGVTGDQLKQVVILGRHNIRTPLRILNKYTDKECPKWSNDLGFLTTKGALLEEYLGEYFSDWFIKENLFTKECPQNEEVFVYANAPQRTKKTAEHFIKSAFKRCNISVNYMEDVTMDPTFQPIYRKPSNSEFSDEFESETVKEMQEKLETINLTDVFERLNTILDVKNSVLCRTEGVCDLTKDKSVIKLKYDKETEITGPLKIANEVVDGFLMAYYDGMDLNKIGWGLIRETDWNLFGKVTQANQDARFNYTKYARNIARPLLNYIKQEFLDAKHNLTLLVGHDSNINSVLAAIGVKAFVLDGQNEKSPIGGKLVFEKWFDEQANSHYLKINFAYLTTEQIRNCARINKENPPRYKVLEMENCSVRDQCPFKEFIELL